MLEKQEYVPRDDEARHDTPRLPLSLSGEINAATRYDFPPHHFFPRVFMNQHTDPARIDPYTQT